MCHQSVGLIQGVLESRGLSTVGISVSEEITAKVGPPRTCYVPYAFGYPLGRPHDRGLQRAIVERALELFRSPGPPPVSGSFSPPGE